MLAAPVQLLSVETPIITIPQEEPRVFFDASIGSILPDGSIADFDNTTYMSLLQDMETADAQDAYQSAAVQVCNPSNRSATQHFKAGYRPDDQLIIVPYTDKANTSLAHETRHYLDDRQDRLGSLGLILATNIVQLVSTAACLPAVAVAECTGMQGTPLAVSLGIAVMALASNTANIIYPWERRARQAQSRYDYAVITETGR